METKILVVVKDVFGRKLAYPKNTQAELLCKLKKKDTFTLPELLLLEEMGFTVETLTIKETYVNNEGENI